MRESAEPAGPKEEEGALGPRKVRRRVLRDAFDCPEVPIEIVFRRREKVVLAEGGR